MSTAVKVSFCLQSVADDRTAAMRAARRKCVDGTFKAVEDMRLTMDAHLKTFLVFVITYFALADMSIVFEKIRDQICRGFHIDSLSSKRFFGQIFHGGFIHPQTHRFLVNSQNPLDRDKLDLFRQETV